MFNIKNLFKKNDESKYKVFSNEEYKEKLRKESKIYQRVLTYIEKNQDKCNEDGFIFKTSISNEDKADEEKITYGLIDVVTTKYTLTFTIDGIEINGDVEMVLLEELYKKILDIYNKCCYDEHLEELEKVLTKMGV